MKDRILDKLITLLPGADVAVLDVLTEQCMESFCEICNLDEAPERAANVICQMVIWHYNQRGAEGLSGQSYSGMSESYATDYPAPLKRSIYRYRRLRTL